MRRLLMLVAAAFALQAGAATAQTFSLGGGGEYDRFTYHFDNESSFDTGTLVPHFFEQTYVADNVWLVGTARYRAGVQWETSAGITPTRTGTGDDYDTFFNSNGDVIVSGTTGGISIWSWRVEQRAVFSGNGPLTLVNGYRLRVDRADWQLGHSTTTRNGRLVDAHDTTDREYTSSQLHEVFAGVRFASRAGGRWRSNLDADATPVFAGRLLVQLPDKYPGRDLVFLAKGASAAVAFAVTHRGRVPLTVGARAFRTWSFSSAARLSRTTFTAQLTIG